MRVLAIGAHPDDLEILCGGTLARYAAAGHEVVMATVANGDLGSYTLGRAEIAQTRDAEARNAAAEIGATYVCLGISDGEVCGTSQVQRLQMVDLVRESSPDVILTHTPNDYMPDHNETASLVFSASFLATLPLLQSSHAAHARVAPLIYMDALAGNQFLPSDYVDITNTIDAKISMLENHQSQLEWLRDHDGVDMTEQVRTAARFRGWQCGVEYAEAFAQCQTWLRATTTRLLP